MGNSPGGHVWRLLDYVLDALDVYLLTLAVTANAPTFLVILA